MSGDESDLRLSDAERQDALDVLGEHFSTGRIDVAEYGERTAQVAAARTRRDLRPLFSDLPEPQPKVLRQQQTAATAPSSGPPARSGRTVPEILVSSAVPIAAIVALVLFVTVFKFWMVFLIPVVVAMCSGRWGRHHPRRGHGRLW